MPEELWTEVHDTEQEVVIKTITKDKKGKKVKWLSEEALQTAMKIRESERESEVAQSCLTLCDPMDCSLPGSSVHGIYQAIVLEWIAISFSRGSSWPRVSCMVDRRFTVWATREVLIIAEQQ